MKVGPAGAFSGKVFIQPEKLSAFERINAQWGLDVSLLELVAVENVYSGIMDHDDS